MPYFCGIDIGASAAKLVIIDAQRRIVAKTVRRSGVDYAADRPALPGGGLAAAGLAESQIRRHVSTGYGRDNVAGPGRQDDRDRLPRQRAPSTSIRQAMTVIDIGAQDCKMIHLDARGCRTGFKMNRKCAAGTGAFLEEIAYRLDLPPADLNGLAERSTRESPLGSFCTVFAATEILEKIRAGVTVEDIVKGAFRSVVKRVLEMDVVDGTLVMTGGVAAHNPALVRLVEETFGRPVLRAARSAVHRRPSGRPCSPWN